MISVFCGEGPRSRRYGGTATLRLLVQPYYDDYFYYYYYYYFLFLVMKHRWNELGRGRPKYSGKTYPSVTLSTTNPTWTDPGIEPGPPHWKAGG
jgi:hypothetical protein